MGHTSKIFHYDYDKQANEIKEIINKTGKACKIKDKNINCLKCKGCKCQ